MTNETRNEIVEHAIRWCSNILAEVLSNHGEYVAPECRSKVEQAVSLLAGERFCSKTQK